MLWTKPPPKRVVTFALRWSRRMTVSEPETFGASRSCCARAPKSCVTVSRVSAGALPAPAPQPASGAASAPRSASSAAGRAALANVEDTAVAAPVPDAVAVERPVDRLDVEHVVPAAEALGQQVREVGAVAHGEEEPAAALRADEPLAAAAEREAAVADPAGEADLHAAHARTALGDRDPDEPRRELREAVDVAAARAEEAGARGGAIDGHAGDGLRGGNRRLARYGDRDEKLVRPHGVGRLGLEALDAGLRERPLGFPGGIGRRPADARPGHRRAVLAVDDVHRGRRADGGACRAGQLQEVVLAEEVERPQHLVTGVHGRLTAPELRLLEVPGEPPELCRRLGVRAEAH